MRKQTALGSFLVSEKTPDAGQLLKTRAEKEDQMILKGSNDAVGRIDTRTYPRKHCTGAPMERAGRPKSAPYIRRAAPYMVAVGA